MKSEIYNALASLNRSLDLAFESLKALQEQGVITADFANDNSVRLNKLWADMNYMIVHQRSRFELEDRDHYGQMLETIDEQLRSEQTISGAPAADKPQSA